MKGCGKYNDDAFKDTADHPISGNNYTVTQRNKNLEDAFAVIVYDFRWLRVQNSRLFCSVTHDIKFPQY